MRRPWMERLRQIQSARADEHQSNDNLHNKIHMNLQGVWTVGPRREMHEEHTDE